MAGGSALPDDDVIGECDETSPRPPHTLTRLVPAMYFALTLLLFFARLCGEIAKKLGQPFVMGEIISGVILGKTVFYHAYPAGWLYLYGPGTKTATAIAAISSVAVTMFLLVAGLEMNLRQIYERRKSAFWVGLLGVIVPFAIGFGVAYSVPEKMGAHAGADVTTFALFVGTALAITALPVVAKTLKDLHLYRTDIGMIVMASATISDLFGWSLFAVVLSLASTTTSSSNGLGLGGTIGLSIVFVLLMLTVVRVASHHILPFLQAYLSWPGGVLGYLVVATFASATFSSWVGLHNTLGAFLAGAAIGDSPHLRPTTREVVDLFVTYIFAPIFFGQIAIKADFIADFDIVVVMLVLVVSCAGKLMGCFVGAKLTKLTNRESLSIAVCMNSRGAMEIILAQVALDSGVIGPSMFVALVIMALLTSLLPGPALRRILRRKDKPSFVSFIAPNGYITDLKGENYQDVIRELCAAVGRADAATSVIAQEERERSGNDDKIAIPHCRLASISRPVVAVGMSKRGVDFGSPDGISLAHFVVLLLSPTGMGGIEAQIITEVTETFARPDFRVDMFEAKSKVEFLALVQIEKYRIKSEQTRIVDTILPREDPRSSLARSDVDVPTLRRSNSGGGGSTAAPRSPALSNLNRTLRQEGGGGYVNARHSDADENDDDDYLREEEVTALNERRPSANGAGMSLSSPRLQNSPGKSPKSFEALELAKV